MKGWPFILLVAALLFLGGYITFVSRYENFFCFTVIKFTRLSYNIIHNFNVVGYLCR